MTLNRILKPSFITKSIEQGYWANEKDYEWSPVDVPAKDLNLGFAPQFWREKIQKEQKVNFFLDFSLLLFRELLKDGMLLFILQPIQLKVLLHYYSLEEQILLQMGLHSTLNSQYSFQLLKLIILESEVRYSR